jgi:uncharacterized protein YjbJ (UPF0337 family)
VLDHRSRLRSAASRIRPRRYNDPSRSTNATEGAFMNWDRAEGNWKQLKGKVKEQWGKITDDDLDRIAGKRDQLVGKIQNSYGIGKDEAEKQLNEWESSQTDVK